jgi:hypothetical protein
MSNDNALHQPRPIRQKSNNRFKSLRLLALSTIVLFITLVAGTGGYLLGTKQAIAPSQPSLSDRISNAHNPSPTLVEQSVIALPTKPPAAKDMIGWNTYSNEMLGFEVKYPPYYDIATNDPYGKRNPKFIDKRYNHGYEPPGLTLDFDPIPAIEMPYYSVSSRSFDIKNRKNNAIRIYFTNARGQKIYATCTVYDPDPNVLNICNTIVSTIKFEL